MKRQTKAQKIAELINRLECYKQGRLAAANKGDRELREYWSEKYYQVRNELRELGIPLIVVNPDKEN